MSNYQRLAVVTETWPPEINGVAMTINNMVERLKQRYQIQLIRPKQSHEDLNEYHDHELTQHLVSGFALPFYKQVRLGYPAQRKLQQLWQQQRPDLIQIVTEGPLGWSALRVAKKLSIPVISEFHTNFHQYSQYYGAAVLLNSTNYYLRWFHNQARLTLVPTNKLKQQLHADNYQQLEVVARGVDTNLYGQHQRQTKLRQSWGAQNSQLVVIHVGRLAPEKNLTLAVSAFREIQKVRPDAVMVMVGDGPTRKKLQTAHPDIIFTGMQRGTALAEHYASADLFLSPSTTETFGNVTLEAMASQLGIICFDYAAAKQHIIHQQQALSVKLNDNQAFIDAAVQLAQQNQLRLQLAQAARIVAENTSWESICHRFDQLAQNIINNEVSYYEQSITSAKSS